MVASRAAQVAALYLLLAAAHAGLAAGVPGSSLRDPLLPAWIRATLLAAEFAALGLVVVPAFALLGGPGRLAGVLRRLALFGLLLGLGASWAVFALGGQFLDGPGLDYGRLNAGALFGLAADLHPLLLPGIPLLALLGAGLLAGPGWRAWTPAPPGLQRAVFRAGIWLLAGSGLVAVAGGFLGLASDGRQFDEASGLAYSSRDLVVQGWARRGGPLSHLASRWILEADPLDREPAADLVERRRPYLALGAWTASADPVRVRDLDVVLVLVDSLRPDMLHAWGSGRSVMPRLDAVAAEGRVFLDCTTPASHTDYAVPSLFASHSPLRSKDVYRFPREIPYPRVLIHDLLKARGYRTALFSSQNEDWGGMRDYLRTPGLDVLEDARSLGGEAWTVDDAVTVDAGLAWWAGLPEEGPRFAAFNLQNAHLPYRVPEGFPRPFGAAVAGLPLTAAGYGRGHAAAARDLYADSLAYVDMQIGRLVDALRASGRWERTIFMATADHGEAFYEHGQALHANGVHAEVMNVPWILAGTGLAPGLESRPAELLDLAPTLLGLLGLPPHPSHQGRDLLGTDPVAEPRSRHLVSDTPWRTHLGLLRGGYKLIYDADERRFSLFDVREDPGETRDVLAERPETAADLRARLSAWRRAQLAYYGNPLRQATEYPPVLEER
jgi:arylsulfatase A-like enzyme